VIIAGIKMIIIDHLKNLIRVKVCHLVVKERDLIDNHGEEDPADEDEAEGEAGPELLPRILRAVGQLVS
jgi:hypothetical protein